MTLIRNNEARERERERERERRARRSIEVRQQTNFHKQHRR